MDIIQIEHLTFYYPNNPKPAIKDFSLSISEGDFLVICGHSGCGKSTLLRQLKTPIAPHGIKTGRINIAGEDITQMSNRDIASKIGFVMQSPENQIVTDKVWHELAFGLESLGYDTPTIRRRVAEMASFFGIQNWFYKSVNELSGGQKQLLNLASVMVMQPQILILDEPTSQLDPIAATDFIATLKKINSELGTTIILTEHRLEEALSVATKAAVMEKGELLFSGKVSEMGVFLKNKGHDFFGAMPTAMQVWGAVTSEFGCPVSVKEGREFLKEYVGLYPVSNEVPTRKMMSFEKRLICVEDVWFRYEKELPDVIKGVNLCAHAGELLTILGGNGTGKSTTLKLISGFLKPYRGSITVEEQVYLLPQNPQTLLLKKSVYEDLYDVLRVQRIETEEKERRVQDIVKLCHLNGLEDRHPYDLSGGEQQRVALAKILLLNPKILLLDEPTKGLDAQFKVELAGILKSLCALGVCIVMVSHDIEFCARYADRCALFFDGNIVTEDCPQRFFSRNSFYTTASNRMAREVIPEAIIADDIIEAIGGENYQPQPKIDNTYKIIYNENVNQEDIKPLPLWRKIGAVFLGLISFCIFIYATKIGDLSRLIDRNGMTQQGENQLYLYGIFSILLIMIALCIGRRSSPPMHCQTPKEKRKLSKRTKLAVVLILLMIPITLFVSVFYLEQKQFYIISLVILLECMIPFVMIFEGRKPKARELVVIASLCAISVAGRAAFFMLPQFKPVMALTIISGVAFGGETGFLVGAMSMLLSNVLFSQGPWTPWQMFAMGMVGFLAGILYQKGWLRRTRSSLCIFGVVCAVLIYGGIMNPAAAFIWGNEYLNWQMIFSYYVTGFPMDCVHAVATGIFLWFLSEGMLEKLDRIKVKYGLVE